MPNKDDNEAVAGEDPVLKTKPRPAARPVEEAPAIPHMELLRANFAQQERQRKLDAGEAVPKAKGKPFDPSATQPKPEHYDRQHSDLLVDEGASHQNERPVQPIGSTKDRTGREIVQANTPREVVWEPNPEDREPATGDNVGISATEPVAGERGEQSIGLPSTHDADGKPIVAAATPRTEGVDDAGGSAAALTVKAAVGEPAPAKRKPAPAKPKPAPAPAAK